MTQTEMEAYLNGIPMWASKKNSLSDIRRYLNELGDPDASMNLIHVAGTNGKGSVCAYLTFMLGEAGYRVLTFTSPHLVTARERFQVNGELVPEPQFGSAFQRVRKLSDTMTKKGFCPPTYFEFLFYMAMTLGDEIRPDFVILETGLGGRLDATNVIRRPLLTVITSVSRDHMQYLGETVGQIAGEKAGILKPGVPVVFDTSNKESRESRPVIETRARELSCPAYPVDGKSWLLRELPELHFSAPADYQVSNAAVALCAVRLLKNRGKLLITETQMKAGVERMYWPGRMEEVLPGVFLDGAHNEGGMNALSAVIRRLQKETEKPVSLMFGVVSDKDHLPMIRELCRDISIRQVTIARMDTERCAPPEEIAGEFREFLTCPIRVFESVKEAWTYFLSEREGAISFCAGSLYLVGEVKGLCQEESNDKF